MALACAVDSRVLPSFEAAGAGGQVGDGMGGTTAQSGNAGAAGMGSAGISGGLSGDGGVGGNGVGGAAGMGGSAGGANGGNVSLMPDAGEDPVEPPCTGCVELAVPLTAASQQAVFQFTYTAPVDFSDAIVTWRVQVLEGLNRSDLFLYTLVQNGDAVLFAGLFGAQLPFAAENGFLSDTWTDVMVNVSASPVPAAGDTTSFDKRVVQSVGIGIGSSAALVTPITARLLVDSVTISGVPSSSAVTFDVNAEGLVLNQYQVPLGTGQPIHHP
jgi:hypothetical protein